ncbi:hypothetical protein [Nocardia vulneris]|uniref:hypothetical protein n=1 Tax=Nocardia vulneris TaxID=1141657 RepID=UPI000B02B09C|nr:hypothetical protein [Nocardia vulneris]
MRRTAAECAAQFDELMAYVVPEDARAGIETFLVDGTDAVLFGISPQPCAPPANRSTVLSPCA